MRYILYGAKEPSAGEVAAAIERSLEVDLELRESSYKGGEYFRHRGESEWEVSVELNWRDEEGILAKPKFPDFPVLVYLSEAPVEIEEIVDVVPQIRKLQSRDL